MDNNNSLKDQFILSIFRLRKITATVTADVKLDSNIINPDLNFNEIVLMRSILFNSLDSHENVFASDIRNFLCITKAAVSQMVASLEKKGYINREIDKQNRRKIVITLTEKGQETVSYTQDIIDKFLTTIISEIGENDAEQFIRIINRFADKTDELKNGNYFKNI